MNFKYSVNPGEPDSLSIMIIDFITIPIMILMSGVFLLLEGKPFTFKWSLFI